MKILIVDDKKSMRMFIRGLLARDRHEIIGEATDGLDAIKILGGLADEKMPDVVLLDIDMPRLDGIETCRRMRSDPRMIDTIIIMATAADDDERIKRAFRSGCDEYIAKPITTELLVKLAAVEKDRDRPAE